MKKDMRVIASGILNYFTRLSIVLASLLLIAIVITEAVLYNKLSVVSCKENPFVIDESGDTICVYYLKRESGLLGGHSSCALTTERTGSPKKCFRRKYNPQTDIVSYDGSGLLYYFSRDTLFVIGSFPEQEDTILTKSSLTIKKVDRHTLDNPFRYPSFSNR